VTEKYSDGFYQISKFLPKEATDKNPKFVFYSDSRLGWRINEKFLRRKNWYTWKMLLFPFYEAYLLGNGFVGGINFLRHRPDYGFQETRMVREAIYSEAKRSKVDFILHGGDLINDGRRPSHWKRFIIDYKVGPPLASDFPFLVVVGNHEKMADLTYGRPNYEAVFGYPSFCVLDFPDVAIFKVDSDFMIDQYQFIDDEEQDALFEKWFVSGENSEQPSWLERELASRNQAFKIVVMHHPLISFGKHHLDWSKPSSGKNLRKKRQQLLDLLHKHGVQIVFSSHEHLYEHSLLRYPSKESQGEDEIHFFVSGGGGAALQTSIDTKKLETYLQNYRVEGLNNILLMKQEAIYHYCLVDIAPDKATIQVFEVTKDTTQTPRLVDEILIPKLLE